MCGFFAIFGNNLNKKNKFKNSSLLLRHRGPDSEKFLFNKNFYMYHSRLSIVDLREKANQPFRDNKERYFLIYNGEIYNYKELKNLLKKNYNFKTKSDTEVLFNAFLEWGVDCLPKLKGMFSFAIWDNKKKKLYISRDNFGQKQLYYYKSKKNFCISSEIKPILNFYGLKKLDNHTVGNYILENDYGPLDRTFFKDINQLSPGTYGVWENGNLNLSKYYLEKNLFDTNSKKNESKNIIKKNIDKHLIGDVNVGLALSSGIDSMSIFSLIKRSKLSHKLKKVFTIDFGNDFSEFNSVQKTLKKFKFNIERIKFHENDVIKNFEKLLIVNEAPLGGIMQMALSKLFEKAKQNKIKVILSGMGSDEIFFGYDNMKKLINKKRSTPKINLIDNTILSNQLYLKNNLMNKIKETQSKVDLYKMLYNTKLPKNLHMMDRVSMHNSVELRCPFIDKDIFEHFSKLKLEEMINQNHTKIILRKIMSSTEKRINWFEKKKNIQSPQNIWMKKGILKEFFGDILHSKSKIQDIYFNHRNIKKNWNNFLKGKVSSALPIWQYTNIYFLNKFIDEN